MVEYGIILLKKKKNVSSMSLDDINNFVEDLKRTEGLLSPTNNNYNNKRNSNSKNRKFSSKKSISNSSFNKSITSNYSSKSSKSLNKKRDYSVKSKSKQKSGFLKRNESYSYNKNIKKNKKINKSFSGSENKNNYTRIKIDSNRELTANNYNFNKNENFGGQLALKDSFNSLSSKDAFFNNKKINNNTFNFASNKKSSKKSFQFNNDNGTKSAFFLESTLDEIIQSNKKYDRKVLLVFNGKETSDESEIIEIKHSLDGNYEVSLNYDDE